MMAETLLQIIEGAPRSLNGQLARRGAGRPGKPGGEPSTLQVRRLRERGRTSPAKDRETGPRSRGRRSGRGPDRNAPTMDNTPGGRRRRRREGRRRSATRRRRWTTGQEVVTDGDVDAAARRQSADQGRDAPVPASQDVVDERHGRGSECRSADRGETPQCRREARRPPRWRKGFRHGLDVSSASPGETGGREPGAPDGHQGTEPTVGQRPGKRTRHAFTQESRRGIAPTRGPL